MQIINSQTAKPVEPLPAIANLLKTISEESLREFVREIAKPRHYSVEAEQNRRTAVWLSNLFRGWGYDVQSHGEFANIVATPKTVSGEVVLVGAHYDTVPMSPGADDNGSAVAAMLGCAAACALWCPTLPVIFVSFNREEEGLLGSRDFVANFLPTAPFRVRVAHILEMVGYASSEPGSQRVPSGLPIKISDRGDFLGLLANSDSKTDMDFVLQHVGAYTPELPVTGLNVNFGMEKYFPVLARSDHAPFWQRNISSVLWTDTSEFRNSNYHLDRDLPETLDYAFLRKVCQLLTACVIAQTGTDW